MPNEPDQLEARLMTAGALPVATVPIPATRPLPGVIVWQGRYFVRITYHDPHIPLGYREVAGIVLQD